MNTNILGPYHLTPSVSGVDTALEQVEQWLGRVAARSAGDEATSAPDQLPTPAIRGELVRQSVIQALERGQAGDARRRIHEAILREPAALESKEWVELQDLEAWPDKWLVAAVRGEPPDEAALDALVRRHWATLFARCHMLTADRHRAQDLAQDTWCRVLRTRTSLRPDGNIAAYLTTVATNLWRDSQRLARRAGDLAENRLVPLDSKLGSEHGGDATSLGDVLQDPQSLAAEDRRRLMLDVDEALSQLSPLHRDVLVARYLIGESCADIGRRHGRTEQTVSGWVREGIRQLKHLLHDAPVSSHREEKL